mmetsp:Transcript_22347/g.45149  ORF Transcript_22347/g.45149 Transcript_22347/m.45149 type:complete len:258 (+) Transcript_22347:1046-1819(+)
MSASVQNEQRMYTYVPALSITVITYLPSECATHQRPCFRFLSNTFTVNGFRPPASSSLRACLARSLSRLALACRFLILSSLPVSPALCCTSFSCSGLSSICACWTLPAVFIISARGVLVAPTAGCAPCKLHAAVRGVPFVPTAGCAPFAIAGSLTFAGCLPVVSLVARTISAACFTGTEFPSAEHRRAMEVEAPAGNCRPFVFPVFWGSWTLDLRGTEAPAGNFRPFAALCRPTLVPLYSRSSFNTVSFSPISLLCL